MKIIFHENYLTEYSGDPAAALGRLDTAVEVLSETYEFIEPTSISNELLLLNHSENVISQIEEDKQQRSTRQEEE